LEREAVHVTASDAHDTKQRMPVLSPAKEALSMICGDDVANALLEDNPRAILEGRALPYFPKPAVKG
jgi:tyrosine-protein phosphatase YwqE